MCNYDLYNIYCLHVRFDNKQLNNFLLLINYSIFNIIIA